MVSKSNEEKNSHVIAGETSASPELRNYDQLKFEVADLIREARAKAFEEKKDELQSKLREVLRHIAEDRYYLTLAGQFSRGKTTLVNAMLGMDRLPTGIMPVTSVITAVTYDPHEKVILHFEGSHLTQDIPLEELPNWITEQGNPGNKEGVKMAEVQLPADILRRGVFLVDTPGLGSAVLENTETTQAFLPQIDALVLVTSFEYPLSSEEISFLHAARSQRCRIFVVVNKLDLCPPSQKDKVLDIISSRVAQEIDERDTEIIFPVSASQALRARLANDNERLEQSCLPSFEHVLVNYLIREKSRDLLLVTCSRLDPLLGELETAATAALRQRLHAINTEITGVERPHLPSQELERPAQSGFHGRLKIGPCEICTAVAQATKDFMLQFQYDLASRVETQVEHAEASGFCAMHSWQYFRLASPQGMAAGYSKTLALTVKRLHDAAIRMRSQAAADSILEETLPDEEKCRACRCARDAERVVMDKLLERISKPPNGEADSFPCLCLMHLASVVKANTDVDISARLLEYQANVLDRLGENMQRFALQHSASHWESVTDEEHHSPELGLQLLVGEASVRFEKKKA